MHTVKTFQITPSSTMSVCHTVDRCSLPRILPPLPGYKTRSLGKTSMLTGWGEKESPHHFLCLTKRFFFLRLPKCMTAFTVLRPLRHFQRRSHDLSPSAVSALLPKTFILLCNYSVEQPLLSYRQ